MILSEGQEFTMMVAQKGYEGYCNATGNKSAVTGDELPAWDDLPGGVINAWYSAADAMISYMATFKVVPDSETISEG